MNQKDKKKMYNEIMEYTAFLKMPATRKYFETEAKEALNSDISYEDYLHRLLQKECDLRHENGKQNRIRLAGFPNKKYLEDLDIKCLPEDAQKKLKILSSLDFINNRC